MGMRLRIVSLLIAATAAPNIAFAASDIALTIVGSEALPLAQGGQTEFTLRIANLGPDPVASVRVASMGLSASYPITMPAQAGCDGLHVGDPVAPFLPFAGLYLLVGPLAAGAQHDCRIVVQRAATETNDGGRRWQTGQDGDPRSINNDVLILFGSLTDVGIRLETLQFALDANGRADALLRLVAENHGPTGVQPFEAGVCIEMLAWSFSVDGGVAQGCGAADHPPICSFAGFGYQRPALAAGESHSCLLRVRGHQPYTTPQEFLLILQNHTLMRADGGLLADTEGANDVAGVLVGPLPPTAVDGLSGSGKLLLIAMLCVLAAAVSIRSRAA
jgi:hypothetical protein